MAITLSTTHKNVWSIVWDFYDLKPLHEDDTLSVYPKVDDNSDVKKHQ